MMDSWWIITDLDVWRRLFAAAYVEIDVVLVLLFWVYVSLNLRAPKDETEVGRRNRVISVSGALAMAVYFTGQLGTRTWGWMAFMIEQGNVATFALNWWLIAAMVSTGVAFVGAVAISVILTPRQWRVALWPLGLLVATVFLVATYSG